MRYFKDIKFVQKRENIGGKSYFFKSAWEINYARWLQWLKDDKQILDWEYEPEFFHFKTIKKGTKCYVVDFRIKLLNGTLEYHEVKGYMDPKSRTKLKRFLKFYPHLSLKLVTGAWFKKYQDQLKAIIPEWIS